MAGSHAREERRQGADLVGQRVEHVERHLGRLALHPASERGSCGTKPIQTTPDRTHQSTAKQSTPNTPRHRRRDLLLVAKHQVNPLVDPLRHEVALERPPQLRREVLRTRRPRRQRHVPHPRPVVPRPEVEPPARPAPPLRDMHVPRPAAEKYGKCNKSCNCNDCRCSAASTARRITRRAPRPLARRGSRARLELTRKSPPDW
jgi:hypothetical protein